MGMARVLVLVADGSEEIETVAMIDVLRRGQLEVVVAGLDGLTVTGSRGIVIQADCRLDQLTDAQLDEFDWLYLPGGLKGAQTFA
ncbi:MAG: DJ-1/PfpI family protein, partial [Negativicutes bacterium]|nr:DJ-1/PfpI family protein [Negativicutes bacterium]